MHRSTKILIIVSIFFAITVSSLFWVIVTLQHASVELERKNEWAKLKASSDAMRLESARSQFDAVIFAAKLAQQPDTNKEILKFLRDLDPRETEYARREVVHQEDIEYAYIGESTIKSDGSLRVTYSLDNLFVLMRPNSYEVVDFKSGGRGGILYLETGKNGETESVLSWTEPDGTEKKFRILESGFELVTLPEK